MTNSELQRQSERKPLIAVIGSARIESGSTNDRLAEEVGELLVDNGFSVLTGGLGGIMESACRGAHNSSNYCFGSTVGILPGHDPADANEWIDIAIPTGLDFARNFVVAHSDAVIAIGGGAGTLTEIAAAWQLYRLIIGMKVEGWSGRLAGTKIDQRKRYPHIPEDQVYPATTANEAIDLINLHIAAYKKQHSNVK